MNIIPSDQKEEGTFEIGAEKSLNADGSKEICVVGTDIIRRPRIAQSSMRNLSEE